MKIGLFTSIMKVGCKIFKVLVEKVVSNKEQKNCGS